MFDGSARIGPDAARLIEAGGHSTHVSIVSLWEVVIKAKLGKLRVSPLLVRTNAARQGWTLLGVHAHHLAALETLPAHHKDPFDHLLIAQAMAENLTLVTDDRQMALYQVRCMACAG